MTNLNDIRKRAEAATEGPWKWSGRKEDEKGFVYHPQGSYLSDTLITLGDTYEDDHHDLDFIANSRTDIPNLLSEIDRLQGELKQADNCVQISLYKVALGRAMEYIKNTKDVANRSRNWEEFKWARGMFYQSVQNLKSKRWL